jgi:hypothetical protein
MFFTSIVIRPFHIHHEGHFVEILLVLLNSSICFFLHQILYIGRMFISITLVLLGFIVHIVLIYD